MTKLYAPVPRNAECDADRIGFLMAAELRTAGLYWFCASQYSGTLGPLLEDARPVEDDPGMIEVGWRPVEVYGSGYGEGFTKGWELGCVGNALSNLREALEYGRMRPEQRERWDASGATVEMIEAAKVAEDRAYVLWSRVTGRDVPSWRSVGTGRDYPEDIEKAAQMRGCGADPCCGQRATESGCIFSGK